MSSVDSRPGLGERPSELLRAAQKGDRNALEQLVENRRADLLSMADGQLDSTLRAKESPSDIVQLSLWQGVESFPQFRGRTFGEFCQYLNVILRNNIRDAHRRYFGTDKRKLSREADHVDPNAQIDEAGLTPSRQFLRKNETSRLLQKFDQLTSRSRQLLQLRYWEQLTFEQIADRLGQLPDTTRKAFYRALSELASAMEEPDTAG